jgi:TPR repeat protein
MYASGHGVAQDYAQAHKWFSLSASRASYAALRDLAVEGRDEVAVKMNPAQRAEAKRMAREWKLK